MNQAQRKHVLKRLKGIRDNQVTSLEEKLDAAVDAKREKLTPSLLVTHIKSGKIKLKPEERKSKDEISNYTDVEDIFDIEKWIYTDDEVTPHKAVVTLENKLDSEIARIEDQLYLGDEADALAMIAAFETFK